MGELIYGAGTVYEIEDRTLAHVKAAVGAKLRRHESFYLSWTPQGNDGRVTLWISPSVPLQFHFNESVPPELSRDWLDALAQSSHSLRGMIISPEADASGILASAHEKSGSPD
ncbi:hypothetical protein GCM10027416_20590 [Okibacterium endophyticum]